MGIHIPYVEEPICPNCLYEECELENGHEVAPIVACQGCSDAAELDADGVFRVTEWPCMLATHYPNSGQIKESLIEQWKGAR